MSTPLISAVSLPYDYDARATCPKWLVFLDTVLEGDVERIKLLQQWFGYLLTPDTTLHAFMVLEGEGAEAFRRDQVELEDGLAEVAAVIPRVAPGGEVHVVVLGGSLLCHSLCSRKKPSFSCAARSEYEKSTMSSTARSV